MHGSCLNQQPGLVKGVLAFLRQQLFRAGQCFPQIGSPTLAMGHVIQSCFSTLRLFCETDIASVWKKISKKKKDPFALGFNSKGFVAFDENWALNWESCNLKVQSKCSLVWSWCVALHVSLPLYCILYFTLIPCFLLSAVINSSYPCGGVHVAVEWYPFQPLGQRAEGMDRYLRCSRFSYYVIKGNCIFISLESTHKTCIFRFTVSVFVIVILNWDSFIFRCLCWISLNHLLLHVKAERLFSAASLHRAWV